jgi:beta-lactamase class D
MSCITPRGRWCNIIVLNVRVTTENKTDDMKDSFCKEVEYVFDKFHKYHMKILLRDFNAQVDREDIFKPTIWNESSLKISNDNGVIAVNLLTSKNLTVKSNVPIS